MRKGSYQPLTAAAVALKEEWRPCVDLCRALQDLREEIDDMEGRPEQTELEQERHAVHTRLEALRAQVRDRITLTDTLTSHERRILRLRYLCADPWDAIALQVGREPSAVYTAYRKALNKVAASRILPLRQVG